MHSSAFAAAWKGCLPPLSHAAYIGDVPALVERLRQGDDVNEAVRLANQSGQDVTGVTPLYLVSHQGVHG
ncbi:hypothetical protein MNEG_9396 [Monoraphidium neglectum]|uniref:Uncharacterized protein n=1 Tax=Monoraphidium neglectum TaxID=145388 RepID=A0A0D2KSR5_9CHLO|nr:hypothetical protein MNEG_9396 [Monoraphidium neglectum]KIY98568.1 hypothetical protein MNEG_9396 [Monoraphidium neglectum]|eukprot:XP_013897588.1 hypothetical protein MNEG_9396 [Monoraphidium neglectum]